MAGSRWRRDPAQGTDAVRRRPGPAWLASSGLRKRLDPLASAVAEWPEWVGPQIAAVTRAVAVTPDGTLVVRVASHPWATELGLMTPRISLLLASMARAVAAYSTFAGPLGPLDRP